MYSKSPFLRVFVALVYLFLLAPIIVVVLVSFNPTSGFRIPTTEVSFRWYEKFFGLAAFRDSLFLISLPVATIASVLATTIGTLAAIGLARSRIFARDAVESFFMLPLLIPSILLGAALYLVYASLGLAGSFWAITVGHTLLGVPYVIRVVGAGLVAVDKRLEEAAISLGCTPTQAFVRVVLPIIRSSILSGAIFAFIVSFSDINLALFVAGPMTTTLPIHIFSQIFWEGDPAIAAASTAQIVIVGGLMLLMQRLFNVRMSF
ncbi:ABC transporter permease [Microvirga massiliensis]|uniref:ABC transporter permease n=1 Tax=Microvirga massiliensis TaxID=1033741 RepID=UPI00062B654A|nr:ABC transporter permease [Microvirga massiliensis]